MAPANRQAVVRWIREVRRSVPAAAFPLSAKGGRLLRRGRQPNHHGAGSRRRDVVRARRKYLKANEKYFWKSGSRFDQTDGITQQHSGDPYRRPRSANSNRARIVVDLRGTLPRSLLSPSRSCCKSCRTRAHSINDLQSWTAQAKGSEISLAGTLTSSGLRRLMSVVESPAADEDVIAKAAEVSPGELLAIQAKNSREYFRAVTGMFNDLKERHENVEEPRFHRSCWFDKYAKRIERMPILNVDEDLLNYSAFVADSMRKAAGAVKAMGIQSNVRQSQIISSSAGYGNTPYRYGRYGSYGGYGAAGVATSYNPVAEAKGVYAERRVVRAEEKGAAATDVQELRQQVIAATTDIRRKMTQKYQIEF